MSWALQPIRKLIERFSEAHDPSRQARAEERSPRPKWPLPFRRAKPKRQLILRLPNELLFQIQSLLPLVSQACLALSCKAFLELSGSVLSDKEFRNQLTDSRYELLPRLEDGRWLYCSRCLKLHPAGEFPEYERKGRPYLRSCMIFAGIVELCPCIRLTFRDKLRLVEQLKKSNHDSGHVYTFHDLGQGGHVWHECLMMDHQDHHVWAVRIRIVPVLESGQLLIHTQYDIDLQMDQWQMLPRRPVIWCCPHNSVLRYTYTPLPEDASCRLCPTFVHCHPGARSNQYSVRVTRNLGEEEWPAGEIWARQRASTYKRLHYVDWMVKRSQRT
ncbi:hypothetical protein VTN77DRAFT_8899 [Rasamsonia byssochlamydoides]|uniref:uncharacterized protein n=1 Tax=Rasamsonia byssochlamydoides TaxID=89139 RepID=UPI003743E8A7